MASEPPLPPVVPSPPREVSAASLMALPLGASLPCQREALLDTSMLPPLPPELLTALPPLAMRSV